MTSAGATRSEHDSCEEILKLRSLLRERNLSAYIIPFSDEHGTVYLVPKRNHRLTFMTVDGLTLTAGIGMVGLSGAWLFLNSYDGEMVQRYLKEGWTVMHKSVDLIDFVKSVLDKGDRVGYDPYLVSQETLDLWTMRSAGAGLTLVGDEQNLVDLIWTDRPSGIGNPIVDYPISLAGETWDSKIGRVRAQMERYGATTLVLVCLEEIAWLLNLRGEGEVEHSPMFRSFLVLTTDNVRLYVEKYDEKRRARQVASEELTRERQGLSFASFDDFYPDLGTLAAGAKEGSVVWIPRLTNSVICALFGGKKTVRLPSPVLSLMSVKNKTEKGGYKNACLNDSVVGCQLFMELERGLIAGESWSELGVLRRIEELRKEYSEYCYTSFPAVSAVGPNSALQLYRATDRTDTMLTPDDIFLLDTGGLYMDGSTDWTRTWHFGTPTDEQLKLYAAVLRGFVDLSTFKFPAGTKFSSIDTMARGGLWELGHGFEHGVGHGVGHTNIVEYPIGMDHVSDQLQAGSVVAIEPGFYAAGRYGLRVEDQFLVIKFLPSGSDDGGDEEDDLFSIPIQEVSEKGIKKRQFLTFQPLTLIPFCQRLLSLQHMTEKEVGYVNGYHELVNGIVGPALREAGKDDVAEWLKAQCSPINI